jgi:NADH-quinone oxidoreductase subunit L
MNHAMLISLIPILPFAGFLLLGLFGKKYFGKASGIVATLLLFASAAIAAYTAYDYFFVSGKLNGVYQTLTPLNIHWLKFSDSLSINIGLVQDPISMMMIVVVSFISLVVHIYSLGYMKGEERFSTFFSYLGLFTFSMLGLVLATNIFQMYIFWELVGLSSFLLIGFYYEKPSAVAACKKAFIVTRFADLGFLIGILVLSNISGTLDFNQMITTLTTSQAGNAKTLVASSFLGISVISWGAFLVFIGGAGKSAMFPLHIWLPDAMEGPTPVSALIHAATMVVAGVYLVARLFPIYAIAAPAVLQLIAYVGAFSAIFAAIIACTQTDIKRVLAYSTMSQIGFMLFALGVSGYGGENALGFTASMFHLFTHAMFKALLFLAAGAIIHYVHTNEMNGMGGLRKNMPITHITFLIACLAISGIPPFAGFFSKEEILLAASQHNPVVYYVALATSGLTAFYMFRLYFSIFWNKSPDEIEAKNHHGEGGFAMMFPLLVLAIGAAVAGLVPFGHYVTADGTRLESSFHLQFSILPVVLALAGIVLAMFFYLKKNDRADKFSRSIKAFYTAAYHKFYIDEIYLFITKKIIFNLVGRPAAWFDKHVVDGIVNLAGATTESVSNGIKKMQSGKIQLYALYFLGGLIVLTLLFMYVIK